MSELTDAVKGWSAQILALAAFIGMIWNRLGLGKKLKTAVERIRSVEVKLDGMLKYKSRAEIAEATLAEKNDVRDRADRKEHDRL